MALHELSEEEFLDLATPKDSYKFEFNKKSICEMKVEDMEPCYLGVDLSFKNCLPPVTTIEEPNGNRRFLNLTAIDHAGKEFKVRALNEDSVTLTKAKLVSAKKALEKIRIIDDSPNITMYNHAWAEINSAINLLSRI